MKVLCRDWGYHVVHQEGSHIILQTEEPTHQRLSVPNHNPVRVGTLNSLIRAVSQHKGVERQELLIPCAENKNAATDGVAARKLRQ